jgi:hypothetical protein
MSQESAEIVRRVYDAVARSDTAAGLALREGEHRPGGLVPNPRRGRRSRRAA